jgi:hypothetical protein
VEGFGRALGIAGDDFFFVSFSFRFFFFANLTFLLDDGGVLIRGGT